MSVEAIESINNIDRDLQIVEQQDQNQDYVLNERDNTVQGIFEPAVDALCPKKNKNSRKLSSSKINVYHLVNVFQAHEAKDNEKTEQLKNQITVYIQLKEKLDELQNLVDHSPSIQETQDNPRVLELLRAIKEEMPESLELPVLEEIDLEGGLKWESQNDFDIWKKKIGFSKERIDSHQKETVSKVELIIQNHKMLLDIIKEITRNYTHHLQSVASNIHRR